MNNLTKAKDTTAPFFNALDQVPSIFKVPRNVPKGLIFE